MEAKDIARPASDNRCSYSFEGAKELAVMLSEAKHLHLPP